VVAHIVRTIGRLLAEMPTMQDYVNGALERIVVDYIAPWRNELSDFIADCCESWDGPKVAEIIELEVEATCNISASTERSSAPRSTMRGLPHASTDAGAFAQNRDRYPGQVR